MAKPKCDIFVRVAFHLSLLKKWHNSINLIQPVRLTSVGWPSTWITSINSQLRCIPDGLGSTIWDNLRIMNNLSVLRLQSTLTSTLLQTSKTRSIYGEVRSPYLRGGGGLGPPLHPILIARSGVNAELQPWPGSRAEIQIFQSNRDCKTTIKLFHFKYLVACSPRHLTSVQMR